LIRPASGFAARGGRQPLSPHKLTAIYIYLQHDHPAVEANRPAGDVTGAAGPVVMVLVISEVAGDRCS